MTNATTWGERIKARREELGLNVPQLANVIGVHPGTVWHWEKSEHAPHRETMIKVADALQTEPCRLFFADECRGA